MTSRKNKIAEYTIPRTVPHPKPFPNLGKQSTYTQLMPNLSFILWQLGQNRLPQLYLKSLVAPVHIVHILNQQTSCTIHFPQDHFLSISASFAKPFHRKQKLPAFAWFYFLTRFKTLVRVPLVSYFPWFRPNRRNLRSWIENSTPSDPSRSPTSQESRYYLLTVRTPQRPRLIPLCQAIGELFAAAAKVFQTLLHSRSR